MQDTKTQVEDLLIFSHASWNAWKRKMCITKSKNYLRQRSLKLSLSLNRFAPFDAEFIFSLLHNYFKLSSIFVHRRIVEKRCSLMFLVAILLTRSRSGGTTLQQHLTDGSTGPDGCDIRDSYSHGLQSFYQRRPRYYASSSAHWFLPEWRPQSARL